MGFRWQFLLKFMVHVWTRRFPRWLWKSQPGNPASQKQYLRQEALPPENPVQELNHINWPILFYFLMEKNEVRKREMTAACLIRAFQTVLNALIFSTGGIQSLSSFPIAFWDLHSAPEFFSWHLLLLAFVFLLCFHRTGKERKLLGVGKEPASCPFPAHPLPGYLSWRTREAGSRLHELAIRFLWYLQWDE